MTKAKRNSVIAALLSLTMVFTLVLGVLPNEVHAVTQAEIDALQEQKDALTAQRQEKQNLKAGTQPCLSRSSPWMRAISSLSSR